MIERMKQAFLLFFLIITFSAAIFAQNNSLAVPGEKHLKNIKQLTFGGENAEAYFSFDGKQLIFQSKRDGRGCDQIYRMNIDGAEVKMVSNGEGRTTCSYFFKGGKKVLYASTFGGKKNARRTLIIPKAMSGQSIPITIFTLQILTVPASRK